MVFKKDLIKFLKKYKIHTIREDVKKLKYIKTIVEDINSNSFKVQI